MAKDHKYHRARIEVDTSLSVDQVLRFAEEVINTQKGFQFIGREDNMISVLMKSWAGLTLLTFTVEAFSVGARTHAITEIQSYHTNQMTVLYFIPIGPREMTAYRPYRRYLQAFEQVTLAADAQARTAIIDMGDGIFMTPPAQAAQAEEPATVTVPVLPVAQSIGIAPELEPKPEPELSAVSAPVRAYAPTPASTFIPAHTTDPVAFDAVSEAPEPTFPPAISPELANQLVVEPATSAESLAEIATHYPHLWPWVRAHPACYDGLAAWIDRAGATA